MKYDSSTGFSLRSPLILLLLILLISGAVYGLFPAKAPADLRNSAFHELKSIRTDMKKKLLRYFEEQQECAVSILQDTLLVGNFKKILARGGRFTLQEEQQIDEQFVLKYGSFYDLLFIDLDGLIFYSVRQEDDFYRNIFSESLGSTALAGQLLHSGDKPFFSGYEFYGPSSETAAFFIIPLFKDGDKIGWFVLQNDMNQLISLLQDHEDLGVTGEVYLVNEQKQMLGQSRFYIPTADLRRTIETDAVVNAFKHGSGELIQQDYRGITVFSSYETINFGDRKWILITEKDESEVLRNYFVRHSKSLLPLVMDQLRISVPPQKDTDAEHLNRPGIRVDMNEFRAAGAADTLHTDGVASCTALVIYLDASFSYMAHISPADAVYNKNPLTKFFSGVHRRNLAAELIDHIYWHRVLPRDRDRLQVNIVASHENSIAAILHILFERNVNPEYITIMYRPDVIGANVSHITADGSTVCEWFGGNTPIFQDSRSTLSLADIMRQILMYSD